MSAKGVRLAFEGDRVSRVSTKKWSATKASIAAEIKKAISMFNEPDSDDEESDEAMPMSRTARRRPPSGSATEGGGPHAGGGTVFQR